LILDKSWTSQVVADQKLFHWKAQNPVCNVPECGINSNTVS
jgi:hypothetical protein